MQPQPLKVSPFRAGVYPGWSSEYWLLPTEHYPAAAGVLDSVGSDVFVAGEVVSGADVGGGVVSG